jgi:2-polyprenyl-6-methoxyphenol hydroxylase-like FAD-dependent oxidoreductase
MNETQTPVLIVGAGPAGLALAHLLGRFGIDHVVVERNATTTAHPKSRSCTTRTMELFRQWGLEDQIRAGGLPSSADVFWLCENLAGRVIAQSEPSAVTPHSPTTKSLAAQDVVEQALDAVVANSPHTDLRRSTEFVALEERQDSVRCRVRSLVSGAEEEIDATYVVACDGAGSSVRRAVGIDMEGPAELARVANYYYRADLSHLPHAGRAAMFLVYPTDPSMATGMILATSREANRWLYGRVLASDDEPLLTEEELTVLVRGHMGIADLEVELIDVAIWRMSAQVASSYRHGRIFLAGDAAHRFPPTGGQGLNSSVQDVHNLAWKVAFVLGGMAGDALLDTYECERRPVAHALTKWSVGNAERLMSLGDCVRSGDALKLREMVVDMANHTHAEGIAMGLSYVL